jgi:hypothetical protein
MDTGIITTSYYLGDRLIAQREGTILRYIHQDHQSSTSVMSDSNGDWVGELSYYPCRPISSLPVREQQKYGTFANTGHVTMTRRLAGLSARICLFLIP